jgi:hypothetical protein
VRGSATLSARRRIRVRGAHEPTLKPALGEVADCDVHTEADAHETEWVQRFDWDPEAAGVTRRTVLGRVEASGELVAAGHLPHPGIGRVGRVNGRRTWQPI